MPSRSEASREDMVVAGLGFPPASEPACAVTVKGEDVRIDVRAVCAAHAFMRTEAPPEPWTPDADDETFFGLLGEMIALGIGRGNDLAELTLSFSNLVVDADADPIPAGEHVAVTVHGRGDWTPERTWSPSVGATPSPFVSPDLESAAARAGAAFGYTRQVGADEGSITLLFRRITAEP